MKAKIQLLACLTFFMVGCINNSEKSRDKTFEKKTPNFLIIVADDMGYTDLGVFGGEINTPTLDRLAEKGTRLTNFHVLPSCSPTRSVLLSGADNHVNGLGSMATTLTSKQKGQPGYEGFLNDQVMKLPNLLKDAGYNTYISGKWHLGHEKENSPHMNGFDESFVLLPGGGSHYSDRKPLSPSQKMTYRRNGVVVKELPKDFYSTKNYTDSLLHWLERDKDNGNPFFSYLAYTAPHDPLHAPEDYIAKYKNLYSVGYDSILNERFNRLKNIGLIPKEAPNPRSPDRLPAWDSLTEKEKLVSALAMAVYAAMIDYMDSQILRVLNWLEQNDQMDNTFIVFFSDNGANAAPASTYPGQTEEYLASFDNHPSNIGLVNSYVATGPTWATVSMFPHKYFKLFTTEGGIKSPCIIHLPESYQKVDNVQTFTHVSDLFPTFLEMAAIPYPNTDDPRFETLIGTSWMPIFKKAGDIARKDGIGYELFGNRAYFKDDWKIVSTIPPFGNGKWKLYNLSEDPFERKDLVNVFPNKLTELAEKWEEYSEMVGIVYDPINVRPDLLKK
jgi:arylsulfatase